MVKAIVAVLAGAAAGVGAFYGVDKLRKGSPGIIEGASAAGTAAVVSTVVCCVWPAKKGA